MVEEKRDPVGSMGNDSALACLSDKPRMLYDYFKQLFAEVTNPPIDSIREEVVMALECFIGPERNLLETTAKHAARLRVENPILNNDQLLRLKSLDGKSACSWDSKTLDITWPRSRGAAGLSETIRRLQAEAEAAVDEGYELIILSDRRTSKKRVPVSALLACGSVHHHLLRKAKRTRVGLVLETGEAREVHHFCTLVGYGADAINPYLAFEALAFLHQEGVLKADNAPGVVSPISISLSARMRSSDPSGIVMRARVPCGAMTTSPRRTSRSVPSGNASAAPARRIITCPISADTVATGAVLSTRRRTA